jgi:translocation and assembly module TamB
MATTDNAAALELAGRFRPATSSDGETAVTLSSLRWLRGGQLFAELAAPVTIRQGSDTGLELSPLSLVAAVPAPRSPAGSGSFALSAEASLKTAATGDAGRLKFATGPVTVAHLTDWLRRVPEAVTASGFVLSSLALDLSWTSPDAPVTGTLRGAFSVDTPLPGERVSATFYLAADTRGAGGGGIELRTAQIRARDTVLAEASGRFPATLHARREGWFRLSDEVPFFFEIASRDGAGWQETLAELTGVKLSGATLHGRVEGTVDEPRGSLALGAAQLEILAGRLPFTLPAVTDARVELVFDGRDGLHMPVARVDIDGQPVVVSGKLPVSADEWARLPETWSRLVRERAEGELHITKAKVASLARYMPTYLAPAGEVSTDIRYGPRQRLEGTLVLEGAASRPLGPLGVLQQIEARLRFHERAVEVESLKALAGGQPVTLAGKADWPRGGRPRVDVTLCGQNVPFVRQTGLVVRGDLDLEAHSFDDDSGRGRISGEVRLRESVFLADLTSLLPGGTRGAARRPPYFSVEEPPFRDWELDVVLRGQRFLRVRTPVFAGLVSTRFNLAGTLGNPRAVGEATVEDGRVIFPFTTFVVQEGGGIRLTEASPYEPRLQLTGAAQRYDYDLRMELGGTATDPTVQFFSSPALDSEQVLMLVMAGMAPAESSFSASSSRLARFGTYVGADVLRQLGVDDSASERLTIRSGEKLSRQGRETYAVEYALGGRWELVGEYDEFDGYNAGVKWRFTPKRPPLPEPPGKAEADNEKTDTLGKSGKRGAP